MTYHDAHAQTGTPLIRTIRKAIEEHRSHTGHHGEYGIKLVFPYDRIPDPQELIQYQVRCSECTWNEICQA